MGYERSDRRYGRDQSYGARDQGQGQSYGPREQGYRPDAYRGGYDRGERGYGRQPQGYDYDDRGFFDRAGDEVRSWFGDEEAERRRRWDERNAERDYQRSGGSAPYGRSDYDRGRSQADRGGSYADRGATGWGDYGGGSGAVRDTPRSTYGGYDGGDFGAGFGAGATGTFGTGAGRDRETWGADPYRSWRDRQIDTFDRDYDEYRREHQSKFDSEFHTWRQTRQGQRDTLGKVREHQEIVGSDGQHVGTVDKVRGDRIILTKTDQDAGGRHHSIPSSWIQSVDDKVTISKSADDAQAHWRDEERNSAFGSNDGRRDDLGASHNLNRSFSGTY